MVRKVDVFDAIELSMLKEVSRFEDFLIVYKDMGYQVSDASSDIEYWINKASLQLEKNELEIKTLVSNYSQEESEHNFRGPQCEISDCCNLGQRGKLCVCQR
jgi:hypothetical protein